MGDTITSGRWTLDVTNRILSRDTSVTPTTVDTVLQLYSDLQSWSDEPAQMDDPPVMSAQTPSEFTIGGTDSTKPWFISPDSAKYLSGGAIQTSGWTRTEGSVNGVLRVPYSGVTDPVASDIGKPIVHEVDSDAGVLLGYDTEQGYLYIRPDSNAAANSFDSTSGNLDVTGGTQNVGAQTAAGVTGESLWANPFSLAPSLQSGTRIYLVQDGTKITDDTAGLYNWPASIGLNADGQIDVLTLVQDHGQVIDDGYITFFARRGGTIYSHFESDLSGGGRVPIPLAPQDNALNDGLGHHQLSFDGGGGTGTFEVGDIIYVTGTPETAGIVAAETDTGAATGTLDYFLTRSLTQFANNDAITNGSRTADVNGAPTDLQPVTDATTISPLTFTAITRDINNGNGARPYTIEVNPNSLSFVRVYRALQYMLRRGSTEQLDGVNGEQYTGLTLQLEYDTQTGNFAEGLVVTGGTSGAFGTIVSDHDDGATGDLILRNVRGTFQDGETITDTGTGSAAVNGDPRSIPTLPSAVLGSIAGGVYFGAPGMFFTLASIASGEEQSYQLVDDDGTSQVPPNTVAVVVLGADTDDWITMFRLDAAFSSGGQIVKDEYDSHATNNAEGDQTVEVQTSISQEAPPSGVIRVEYDTDLEDRYVYSSFSGTTFTLTSIPTGTVTTPDANGITLTDSAGDFVNDGVLPGMLVQNTTDGSVGTVKTVDSATQITLDGAGLAGGTENDFDNTDGYEINRLVRTYDGSDTVYVPFLDLKYVSSASTTVIQSTDIDVLTRVRQGPGQAADDKILPFQIGGTIGSSGITVNAVRTPDTIATS